MLVFGDSVGERLRVDGEVATVSDGLSHPKFLYRLLHDEVERREGKQLDQRVRRAGFEQPTTLEDFDFHFNPTIPCR